MCSFILICYFSKTWLRFWILFGLLYCTISAYSILNTDSTQSQFAMASGSSGNGRQETGPSTSSGLGGAVFEDVFEDDGPFFDRHLYSEEVLMMWNLARIIKKLGTNEQCVAFAEENELVQTKKLCRTHRTAMKIAKSTNKSFGSWCCTKGNCKTKSKIPRNNGTFFENIKINLVHVFYLLYAYSKKWSYNTVINEDPYKEDFERCLGRVTISDWYNYCRETVVLYQINKNRAVKRIGGLGKIVQIDESKFGKRKYNQGRHIEGHWVLGMIEDGTEDLRLEVCPGNIRSAEVLVPLILKNVEVGTTIYTSYWRSYDCLSEHGYVVKKVNQSDPDNPLISEDRTHTQRIKSQWRSVKSFFKKEHFNNTENLADVIFEYLWRRNIIKYKKDPFIELVKAIKYVYKVK